MGMHALPTTGWTVDMLETLPDDGKRYEIIDGELFVTPAPYLVHQIIAAELNARLRDYLRAHPVGRAIVAPADVRVGDRTSVEPGVFVIPQILTERLEWRPSGLVEPLVIDLPELFAEVE